MFVAYVQLFIVQFFEVSSQIDVSLVDCISVFSRGRETSSQAHSVQCKSIFDVCNAIVDLKFHLGCCRLTGTEVEAEFERLLAEANELFCRVGKDGGRHMVEFMVAFSGFWYIPWHCRCVHPELVKAASSR